MFWGVFIVSVIASRIFYGEPLWILSFVLGIGANMIFRKFYPRTPDAIVPPKSEPEEDVHAKTVEEMRKDTIDKIRRAQEALRAARESGVSEAPKPKPLNLTAASLKVLRNNLLQHHNMKQTDQDYLASDLCRSTNHLIQQLNDLIDKEKKAA